MRDLVRQALDVLVFVGALSGLLLFAGAVVGFLAAVARVAILGRVLVVPFRGIDERRVAITELFARRLMEIEEHWTALAREIKSRKTQFEAQSTTTLPSMREGDDADEALAAGAPLSREITDPSRVHPFPTIGAGPRTTGDDFIDDIILLDQTASVANADLGVVSVAGVSVSPQTILALLRGLPGIFARRLLSGSIVAFGDTTLLNVSYEERRPGRNARPVRCRIEVSGENWTSAIEDLAFELAKGRIELLRRKGGHPHRDVHRRSVLALPASQMADRAVVEATSWAACEAFLHGYVWHLQHYVTGEGAARDRALRCYETAVQAQPGYTRAIYHRATLLYNRYLPNANEEAIAGYEEATSSEDTRVRALAYAGLAMSYCQAVHRFGRDRAEVLSKAWKASEQAIEIDAALEEAGVAQAWAWQIREEWEAAIERYDAVARDAGNSAPARRIASFACNNAGWISLQPLRDRDGALRNAERRLWKAVRLYPNKVAYGNLAEIARRYRRYDDARALFVLALRLDPQYVNGWNERACLEVEIAATAHGAEAAEALDASTAHHLRAVELAADDLYAERLRTDYMATLDHHSLLDRVRRQEAWAGLT